MMRNSICIGRRLSVSEFFLSVYMCFSLLARAAAK